MVKRKLRVLGFYKWEIIFRIEVASNDCQKIYQHLGDTLFKEFKTSAVLSPAYADEKCAHFRLKTDPKDQKKIKNLLLKFCREQNLVFCED
jgi:hypothetical protein